MRCVKNSKGKTICKVDIKGKQFEIVNKGIKTMIKFLPNDTIQVIDMNYK